MQRTALTQLLSAKWCEELRPKLVRPMVQKIERTPSLPLDT